MMFGGWYLTERPLGSRVDFDGCAYIAVKGDGVTRHGQSGDLVLLRRTKMLNHNACSYTDTRDIESHPPEFMKLATLRSSFHGGDAGWRGVNELVTVAQRCTSEGVDV
ncbi:hypothetical protein MPH_07890 [Macrophomina phaseolina MS6]|uniref:Uncharacterized protein n=1 Tax=Macrophomina phaseolina (strain MS6) TaxID=1126212 RepID=K2SDR0_MACPH|nr:hypothetical protein MPH_07890 [Macrophomina phaseolina MS6]